MAFQSGVAAVNSTPHLALTWLVAIVLVSCILLFLGMLALEVWRSVRFARHMLALTKSPAAEARARVGGGGSGPRRAVSQLGDAGQWAIEGEAPAAKHGPAPCPPPGATDAAADGGPIAVAAAAFDPAAGLNPSWVHNPLRVSVRGGGGGGAWDGEGGSASAGAAAGGAPLPALPARFPGGGGLSARLGARRASRVLGPLRSVRRTGDGVPGRPPQAGAAAGATDAGSAFPGNAIAQPPADVEGWVQGR
jgi:hypothetical protein